MLKIWVKLIEKEKIVKDIIYNFNGKYSRNNFEVFLREVCENLDIPTPLLLQSHINHFENFNQAKFFSHEFVESISFDNLILENITDM